MAEVKEHLKHVLKLAKVENDVERYIYSEKLKRSLVLLSSLVLMALYCQGVLNTKVDASSRDFGIIILCGISFVLFKD